MINDNYNSSLELLKRMGWDSSFEDSFNSIKINGTIPARIISASKNSFQVFCSYGELNAVVTGRLFYQTEKGEVYPAVGDWVAVEPLIEEQKAVIHAVLPRRSKFSRKEAGARTREQVVAVNIDTAFIVSGLDGGRNFNLRRIERYLTLSWNSGAVPVLVLNKADLCENPASYLDQIEIIAAGVPVHLISAVKHTGLNALSEYTGPGKTTVLLGSSGVGKSALINALLGTDKQETGELRERDHTGKHTTTRRELFLLPRGGAVIDTPGMREIQLWADQEDLDNTFEDIIELAHNCRFPDCTHTTEPGCAVLEALENGTLDYKRFESFRKLRNELDYISSREEYSARYLEKVKWKKVAQWQKQYKNIKDKY